MFPSTPSYIELLTTSNAIPNRTARDVIITNKRIMIGYIHLLFPFKELFNNSNFWFRELNKTENQHGILGFGITRDVKLENLEYGSDDFGAFLKITAALGLKMKTIRKIYHPKAKEIFHRIS